MRLDLSKEAALNKESESIYKKLRVALYFLALVFFFYVAFKTVFPSEYFSFSFLNASSLKNTLTDMQNKDGRFPEKGAIPEKNTAVFYASPFSKDHSQAVISIALDKKSSPLKNGSISVRKSFKAFFYPTGTPTNANGKNVQSAIKNGTIVTDAQSAYVVSGQELLPFDSLTTFDALGYKWADAIAVNSDEGTELAEYERGKLLNITSAHPNGTIFSTQEDNKLYLIENTEKNPLASLTEAKKLSNSDPILVSEKSLDTEAGCELQKNKLAIRTYSCTASIDELAGLLGKDYQFQFKADNDAQIDSIKVEFKKNISSENMRFMISSLVRRIKTNYVPESN